ncbi:MAG TPA: alpha/beta hydrolase [Chthoniobacteraceae bacterium]|nr:alpha/beta hydrolase [Chthoniobacteraceae bacterium]
MKLTSSFLFCLVLLVAPCFAPAQQARPELPADARKFMDVPYVAGGHPAQKLDLYLPAKPGGPLLVWIHGGGWRSGSKANPPGLAMVAQGYNVASLEYRFSQDAIFPAQIEDCKAAIRWLRAHATEYGYDPKRVGVWGASAGGHLTALLAVTGNVRDFDVGENLGQSSAIQCGLDWFGPADFPAYDPELPTPMVKRENPDSVLAQLFGGPISQHLELAKRGSPVTWVTKDAAPLLIMQGTKDPLVPLEQSQRLYDKLKAAGADATLDVIEGAGHGGPQFTAPEKLTLILDFFTRHLGAGS